MCLSIVSVMSNGWHIIGTQLKYLHGWCGWWNQCSDYISLSESHIAHNRKPNRTAAELSHKHFLKGRSTGPLINTSTPSIGFSHLSQVISEIMNTECTKWGAKGNISLPQEHSNSLLPTYYLPSKADLLLPTPVHRKTPNPPIPDVVT